MGALSAVTSKPVLPQLPTNGAVVTADYRAIVQQSLARFGLIGGSNEAKARKIIDEITAKVAPKLAREADAAGALPDYLVDKIVGKEQFDQLQNKTVRRRWIVGSVGFVAGMGFSGGLNIAVSQGFKALGHLHWAAPWVEGVNTAFSPALFLVSGALAGAVTYLFLELTTTPVSSWFGSFAFKGSPIVSHLNAKSSASFVDAYNAANQIDTRVFTAIATMTSLLFNLELTLGGAGGVRDLLRQARTATGDAKADLIKEAGELLGGKLIYTEIGHFHFDPMFDEIFQLIHAAVGSTFERLPADDAKAFEDAVIGYVTAKRPNSADGDRPTTQKALESYFKPFLSRLMKGAPNGQLGAAHAA